MTIININNEDPLLAVKISVAVHRARRVALGEEQQGIFSNTAV